MKPELKPCEDTLLLIHKSFCRQQQERIQNDLGHVYATATLECERAYEIGYEAGRKAAFAEIAAAKAHSVPKVDPHPTLDLFSHVDTTNENGERIATGLKRKSPEPHDVFHHSDEFWLNVCREYQQLKHRNPNLTQADFVRIKANPRIKIKTFNAKLLQLTTTGTFAHKPRIRRK